MPYIFVKNRQVWVSILGCHISCSSYFHEFVTYFYVTSHIGFGMINGVVMDGEAYCLVCLIEKIGKA